MSVSSIRLGSIKSTLIINIMFVGVFSQLVSGVSQYLSQAESSREEFRNISEAVMQPVVGLASRGVDGGNQMMLASKDSQSLYESRKVLFLKVSGMSTGSEKTSYSDAIPPSPLSYEYMPEKSGADKAKAAVLAGNKGMIESDMLYVVSYPLQVKNGGEVTAVFSTEQLRDRERKVMTEVGVKSLGVLFVALVLAVFIGRRIAGPIEDISRQINEVTESMNLNVRVTTTNKHEIGQIADSFNSLVSNLHSLITQIQNTSKTIKTSIGDISQGNADLSQRTEEQASSLEETASSMEELTSTVKQNADNAKQANQLAYSASDIAVKGGKAVGEVVLTMASISDSSKKIADIISVIDSIAFQTNILALNAAVEAARAGEQGRGFAVVAAEVRNLAQRSAGAAREIKTLIDDSVGKVYAGSKQVDEAGATMTEIVQAVKRVTDIMSEIAAASNEQSAGIEQVNKAIVQMDEVTQQNAALVEEAAAAAEAMQKQAGVLLEAVSIFKLEEGKVIARTNAAKPTSTDPAKLLALPA